MFLPNVPGATFIQGGTFIPDSRVCAKSKLLKITQDIRQSLLCVTRLTTNAEITEKSSSLCIKKEIQTKKKSIAQASWPNYCCI